ncbi:MAG: thiamine pyrophosphate-binding protein [Candidatus Limnocylindria bacterium]
MVARPAPTDARPPGRVRPLEGGDLLVASLEARGVRRLFSVSGGPINSVYHATLHSSVELCHVRHEAAAGFMADATARVTGVPGVAVVTLGPGVTNAVTPVATALRAGVPMLVVGGQAPSDQVDREPGMSIDGVAAMRPVTKWAAAVSAAARIPEYVEEAWRRMTSGRPGPAYLEIPVDVLTTTVDSLPTVRGERRLAAPAPPELAADVGEALRAARRPLLIGGDDVFFSRAGATLRAFVERHRVPFALLRLARGAVDERHPLFAGPAYTPANPVFRRALGETDCVLLVGHPWEFDLEYGAALADDAVVVHVYPDAVVLGRHRRCDLAADCTAESFLSSLAAAPAGVRDDAWISELVAEWRDVRVRTSREARAASAGGAMHPVTLVEEILAAAPEQTIFVTSHGNIDFWADAQIEVGPQTRYLRAGQYGPLGAEIPYGIAAKLAEPNHAAIVFVGDGGFGYHCLELETAARYGAAAIVVVADDESWGAIAMPQREAYGVEVEMDLPRRDWPSLVEALGGYGEAVDDPVDVGPALSRCLASGLPSVMHVRVASVLSPYMEYISR